MPSDERARAHTRTRSHAHGGTRLGVCLVPPADDRPESAIDDLITDLTHALSLGDILAAGEEIVALDASIQELSGERARLTATPGAPGAAARELTASIAAKTAELDGKRSAQRGRLVRASVDFPAFGCVMGTQELIGATRRAIFERGGGARARPDTRELIGLIGRYTDAIMVIWAPGFDAGALAELAASASRTAALARAPHTSPAPHPTYLFSPMAPRDLLALGARRLIGSGYHERLGGLSAFSEQVEGYQRMLMVEEVHSSVHAHPPMALVGAAHMLLGGALALTPRTDPATSSGGGHTTTRDVASPLIPLLVATDRLIRILTRHFAPLLATCERALGPIRGLVASYKEGAHAPPWLVDYHRALVAAGAPDNVAAICTHASVLGWASDERRRTSARITEVDRLVFWRDTPDEARFASLNAKRKAHAEMIRRHDDELLARAAGCVQQVDRFAFIDATDDLIGALVGVRTHARPVPSNYVCRVEGREHAREQLTRVASLLRERFGVAHDHALLMADTARAIDAGQAGQAGGAGAPGGQRAAVPQRARLVAMLSGRLEHSNFARAHEVMAGIGQRLEELEGLIAAAGARVAAESVASVLRGSAAQDELEAWRDERSELESTLSKMGYVAQAFDEALLECDPLAWTSCQVGLLLSQLDGLYAECRFDRLRKDDFDYECVLVGGEEFAERARTLAHVRRSVWGERVPVHELVTLWASRHMSEVDRVQGGEQGAGTRMEHDPHEEAGA
jgi:hypothetical protein